MYLGPVHENKEILNIIDKYSNLKFTILKKDEIFNQILKKLNNNKIIGIFNNKMEFGPGLYAIDLLFFLQLINILIVLLIKD